MAKSTFKNLDDESLALHDSWDHIARIVLIVTALSATTWAACTVLRVAVHEASHLLLHTTAHGEGWVGPAVLLSVLVAAGVVRGVLVRRAGWADAAGDGMDVALRNYHITYEHEGDDPQPRYDMPAFRLALRKGGLTFLTLGSGGSGGLEAPVVLISECLAAGFSRVMAVASEFELRTYQLAAISAAVSTLLGAPFTAALFATEVAYGDRIIYRKFAYALWAGVLAYILNNRLHGYQPLFTAAPHGATYTMAEYGVTTLVAIAVSAPLALGFGIALTTTRNAVRTVHPMLHGAVSSLAIGLIALGLWKGVGIAPHHVLGMGEETISLVLNNEPDLLVWWVLLLILAGKILTEPASPSRAGAARAC